MPNPVDTVRAQNGIKVSLNKARAFLQSSRPLVPPAREERRRDTEVGYAEDIRLFILIDRHNDL